MLAVGFSNKKRRKSVNTAPLGSERVCVCVSVVLLERGFPLFPGFAVNFPCRAGESSFECKKKVVPLQMPVVYTAFSVFR